jgi:hypothetical protein
MVLCIAQGCIDDEASRREIPQNMSHLISPIQPDTLYSDEAESLENHFDRKSSLCYRM